MNYREPCKGALAMLKLRSELLRIQLSWTGERLRARTLSESVEALGRLVDAGQAGRAEIDQVDSILDKVNESLAWRPGEARAAVDALARRVLGMELRARGHLRVVR